MKKEGCDDCPRQSECYQVAHQEQNDNGQTLITLRDILLVRKGKHHIIRVTTPQHLEEIRQSNEGLKLEDQMDDHVFIVPEMPESVEELCAQLAQIPDEVLSSYWTEQTPFISMNSLPNEESVNDLDIP